MLKARRAASRHVLSSIASLAFAIIAIARFSPAQTQDRQPPPALAADTNLSCENLAYLKLPDTAIDSAHLIAAGRDYKTDPKIQPLPEFCEVSGQILNMPWGPVEFVVWLPTKTWNHERMGIGNGAPDGSFNYFSLSRALNDGYATGGTRVTYDMQATHEFSPRFRKIVWAFYPATPKLSKD
jgi:hypothetical protein